MAMLPEESDAAEHLDVQLLQGHLSELEDIVRAIRGGIVDAFVVGEENRERVFTLTGTDHPYRMLVEAMQEGALALDNEGFIIYANPSIARMLGAPAADLHGHRFEEFVVPADRERVHALLTQELGDRAEVALVRTDGGSFPAHVSGRPADLGNVHGTSVVVTDLSHQKKQAEVLASERLARAILDQAAEAILVCDGDGRVTHASRQSELLCGRYPVSQPLCDLFPLQGEDGEVLTESDLLGVSVVGREVTYRVADGRTVNLLLSCSPLVNDSGDILGTVLILTDFTERKQAELTLRNLNDVLEARIAERTATLEQRNRELQSFAFVASHDLQEPLRKIQSFASLFINEHEDTLTDDGRFYLDRIQNAAARMSQLLADVLAFSRVSTQQQPFERVRLQDVADEVLANLDLSIEEAGASVDVDAPVVVNADRSQLRLLFNHLIQNAIKFRRDGVPPHVRIRAKLDHTASVHAPDTRVHVCRLTVEDNGIGFQERFAERIFEPLQRLHGRGNYPGTGIGLSICRRIAERHNGTITATSTPGEGSRFEVIMPVD